MFNKIASLGVLFFVMMFGIAAVGAAQDASTGSISGTITDSTGAVVKGATVTLLNTDRNAVERTLTTNASGFYTATSLPLGHYVVKVADKGFKGETVTGIELHVSDALTVSTKLSPGSEGESVTVTAETQSVNLEDATSAGLINSTQINEMVMVSRNYESLMNLQPGVAYGGATDNLQRGPVGVNGASSVVNFSVNGSRNTSNNWTIDGADNLDRGANLTVYVYPAPDAIAEFKTLRGQYSAAYGRDSAGQVDVVIKSGTNSLHGSAYEYFRNDFLDAPGYLAGQNGTKIAKYRYNDFGFTIGGPVWIPHVYNGKNKTFFFVSENWLREIAYSPATNAIVPTAAERTGDFSNDWYQVTGGAWVQGPVTVCTAFTNTGTTNTCTATGTKVTNFSPTATAYLKDLYSKIPLPDQAYDLAHNLDPHTIVNNIPNRYPNLDTVVRIDQQIGQKFSVMYHYIHDTFPDFIGSGTFVAVPIPGISGTLSNNPGSQHVAKGTWTISPTMVANIGYNYSNGSINTVPQGALLSSESPDVKPTLPYANVVGLIPSLNFNATMTTLGGSAVYNDHGINHEAFGDITKVYHNHTFIAGFQYNHYQKVENSTSSGNQGTFNFTGDTGFGITPPANSIAVTVNEDQSFANFLTGNVNNGFSQTSRNPKVDINENIYGVFLQDNWKMSPRLTVNIGARYDYVAAPTDAAGFMSNFDPATYSASKAPTIAANGSICFTSPCSQNGSSAGQLTTANAGADYVGPNYLNGLIFGTPSAASNNQASPFGKSVTQMQKTAISPRVGFSWDVFGDGKTALRGGYGWAFDELEVSYWETTDFGNPPAVSTYSQTQASMDNPSNGASGNTPSATAGRIQAVPLNAATPYMQQYSLGIQQQIAPSLFMELAYVGTHGTHLAGAEEINQPVPNAWKGVLDPRVSTPSSNCTLAGYSGPALISTACDAVLNSIRPYLGYFAIDAMRTIFSSNYNGLQVKATKKFSGKSYIDANFTWSHDLTNAPADYSGFIQNIYNVNGDYGRAPDDRKLVFTMDGVWELPWYRDQKGFIGHVIGGWEFSGIYTANSGLPLTVSASGGISLVNHGNFVATPPANNPNNIVNDNVGLGVLGNTNAGLRPNQIGDPNGGPGLRLSKRANNATTPFFNTGAFQAQDPASSVPGSARRGSINGPGFNKADIGIFRNFRIYDRLKFQFRGEAFNVFNHTNVQTIGVAATSATFGEITAYRDARILQIGGRFDF